MQIFNGLPGLDARRDGFESASINLSLSTNLSGDSLLSLAESIVDGDNKVTITLSAESYQLATENGALDTLVNKHCVVQQ